MAVAQTKPLDRIEEHFVVELGLPVDLSDLMEERKGLRSGRIEEASDLATVPMDDASPTDSPTETDDAETTAYEMQLRAAELW